MTSEGNRLAATQNIERRTQDAGRRTQNADSGTDGVLVLVLECALHSSARSGSGSLLLWAYFQPILLLRLHRSGQWASPPAIRVITQSLRRLPSPQPSGHRTILNPAIS